MTWASISCNKLDVPLQHIYSSLHILYYMHGTCMLACMHIYTLKYSSTKLDLYACMHGQQKHWRRSEHSVKLYGGVGLPPDCKYTRVHIYATTLRRPAPASRRRGIEEDRHYWGPVRPGVSMCRWAVTVTSSAVTMPVCAQHTEDKLARWLS